MTERRASARRAADWRVFFGPPGELSPGFLADLSPIGVSILSEKQYPIGTEVEVHFGVEESEGRGKLRMRAVVRHSGKRPSWRSFHERGLHAARTVVENHAQ